MVDIIVWKMISNKFLLPKIVSLEQCFVFFGGKFCIVEIIFWKKKYFITIFPGFWEKLLKKTKHSSKKIIKNEIR